MPESLLRRALSVHASRATCTMRSPRCVPPEIIHLGKKLVGLDQAAGRVTLAFADGTRGDSRCRDRRRRRALARARHHRRARTTPLHKGRIAYRAVFPAVADGRQRHRPLAHQVVGPRPPHRHLLHDEPTRSEIYFVTSVPEPAEWLTRESWSAKGDVNELRAAYAGFHPDVRAVLDACPDCHKWAILERDPLPRWSDGRVVLLGDACHPMTPYMAQGAATSIEDAAVLARCLDDDRRRRHRGRVPALRGAPQAAHLARSRRSRAPTPGCSEGNDDTALALRLRRLERAAR